MIIHQRSLTKVFLKVAILLSVSISTFAQSVYCPASFDVLERAKKDKYKFVNTRLKDLYCGNVFEGEYFKIVYSTNDNAINFTDDPELVKKAANVYHHLTVARDFWVNNIKSEHVKNFHKLTVRLDITNSYSKTRQFQNTERQKDYNNAWTTPAGKTPRFLKDKKEWDQEIWFNPMKRINSREKVKSKGKNPIHQSFKLVQEPIVDMNKSGLLFQGLSFLAEPSFTDSSFITMAIQRVGIIGITFGLTEITKHMDKLFVDKYLFVDTAMVPDIIYHEFAHVAMSDTMKTTHSVPVIEGMADYFAARVHERKNMYQKLDKISSNRSKNLKNKSLYNPFLEQSWNATSDYTLSLLWKARMEFEIQNEKRIKKGKKPLANFDEIVHHTHFSLTENSDIMNNLARELVNACKEKCSSKRLGIDTLNKAFEAKGLN